MPAPKGNQNAKGNKGGTGRPSSYRLEHVQTVRTMAARGWSEIEMAHALSVHIDTFRSWKLKHLEFYQALQATPEEKRQAVEASLFHRCMGFDRPAVKIMTVSVGNGVSQVVEVPYVEHYPPDVAAIRYFLNNKSNGEFKDTQQVEQTGDVVVRVEGGLPDKKTD